MWRKCVAFLIEVRKDLQKGSSSLLSCFSCPCLSLSCLVQTQRICNHLSMPRREHAKAIRWTNDTSDSKTNYYWRWQQHLLRDGNNRSGVETTLGSSWICLPYLEANLFAFWPLPSFWVPWRNLTYFDPIREVCLFFDLQVRCVTRHNMPTQTYIQRVILNGQEPDCHQLTGLSDVSCSSDIVWKSRLVQ